MTIRFLLGDVFDRLADIPDSSVDLILTSPPFLGLRSYLPADHPKKAQEIGSEPSPAEYLDVLLNLTAEWRRVLAPHGSLAVELGDKYAGSGGAGGDYRKNGMREGQSTFPAVPSGNDWPLAKGLCFVPTLYGASLAYGRNLLTGEKSPAGQWRVRNVKPWIRSNPPVGALGDKERPATSYVIVACTSANRWFDLDAVRTPFSPGNERPNPERRNGDKAHGATDEVASKLVARTNTHAGAPPLDWWHHVDAVLDAVLDAYAAKAGRPNGGKTADGKLASGPDEVRRGLVRQQTILQPARGVHLRRALEAAGILTTADALDVTARGYKGAHYAVWPPELCRRLIEEMCPREVCEVCGEPRRRVTKAHRSNGRRSDDYQAGREHAGGAFDRIGATEYQTLGWSDCGHASYRPGLILDPFVGSGTTLAVAADLSRDALGIDFDVRNLALALRRCGSDLTFDVRTPTPAPAPISA